MHKEPHIWHVPPCQLCKGIELSNNFNALYMRPRACMTAMCCPGGIFKTVRKDLSSSSI